MDSYRSFSPSLFEDYSGLSTKCKIETKPKRTLRDYFKVRRGSFTDRQKSPKSPVEKDLITIVEDENDDSESYTNREYLKNKNRDDFKSSTISQCNFKKRKLSIQSNSSSSNDLIIEFSPPSNSSQNQTSDALLESIINKSESRKLSRKLSSLLVENEELDISIEFSQNTIINDNVIIEKESEDDISNNALEKSCFSQINLTQFCNDLLIQSDNNNVSSQDKNSLDKNLSGNIKDLIDIDIFQNNTLEFVENEQESQSILLNSQMCQEKSKSSQLNLKSTIEKEEVNSQLEELLLSQKSNYNYFVNNTQYNYDVLENTQSSKDVPNSQLNKSDNLLISENYNMNNSTQYSYDLIVNTQPSQNMQYSQFNLDAIQSEPEKPKETDVKLIMKTLEKIDDSFMMISTIYGEEVNACSESTDLTVCNWMNLTETSPEKVLSKPDKMLKASLDAIVKDKKLIYGDENTDDGFKELSIHDRNNLVSKNIYKVLNSLLIDAVEGKPLCFKYCDFGRSNCVMKNNKMCLKPVEVAKYVVVKKQAKNSEAKFKLMLFLLEKVMYLIANKASLTKREIYYELRSTGAKIGSVYIALNAISSMLEVPPWYFNIYSTRKGLAYGALKITIEGQEIDFNTKGGTLIPSDTVHISKIESKVYFILIVEKDTIFQKILDEDIPNKLIRPFLLITGKGYADMSTQLFIKKIWMTCKIPVFIIVDADPNGIEIMLTYRFGSLTLSHLSDFLPLPQLRWIGVHPSEILALNVDHIPLSEKDIIKIKALLARPYMKTNPKIKKELNIMLKKNFKAEIEGLIKCNQSLGDVYIPEKFYGKDFF